MGAVLKCDGCGSVIRDGYRDLNARYRANHFEPGRHIFEIAANDGWDFCSIGCMATWATEQEMQTARDGGR